MDKQNNGVEVQIRFLNNVRNGINILQKPLKQFIFAQQMLSMGSPIKECGNCLSIFVSVSIN